MKIMFICTGNVRRSIMAVSMFRELVKGTKYEGQIMCQSAGVAPVVGQSPTENVVTVMSEIGIDVSKYKARKLAKDEIEVWDAYFVMSETHAYILNQGGIPVGKVYRTRVTIDDPLDKTIEEYRECRDQIKEELEEFYRRLIKYLEV